MIENLAKNEAFVSTEDLILILTYFLISQMRSIIDGLEDELSNLK